MIGSNWVHNWARILVQYSTRVENGDRVRISGTPVASPLIEAVYAEVLRAGGHPIVRCVPDACNDLFLHLANDAQLAYVDPLAVSEIESIDVTIGIMSETILPHCPRGRSAWS